LSERIQLNAIEAAAEILNVELSTLQVRSRYELDEIFDAARRRGAAAVLLPSSPIIGSNEKLVADLALKHRLPAVTTFTDFPRVGGFMAYGPNLLDMIRHLGGMTAKVLQGRKPADLPVERPSRSEDGEGAGLARSHIDSYPRRRGDRIELAAVHIGREWPIGRFAVARQFGRRRGSKRTSRRAYEYTAQH
jgi:hypothetical protein